MRFPRHHTVLDSLAATFAGGTVFFGMLLFAAHPQVGLVAPTTPQFPTAITVAPEMLTAQSAVVYDPGTNRILYAKEANVQRPLASLTKLMAAAAVLSAQKENRAVTITREDIAPEGDWDLRVGESWPLYDLVKLGLVASSNDAMAAAAASVGGSLIDTMNQAAKNLGLSHTYFLNPTGLDEDLETAGAYGSAHDMALLTATFLQEFPDFFEATAQEGGITIQNGDHLIYANATTEPLHALPGLIGAKTGYTDLAGGNLVAAVDIEVGRPLIIAVLGSTREGRFTDVETLVQALRGTLVASSTTP